MNVRRLLDFLFALLLFSVALALYLVTLSKGAFPGYSSQLIAARAGLFPNLSPTYPIWRAICSVWGHLPIGTYAFRLNLLSALVGALCIPLAYQCVRSWVQMLLEGDEVNAARSELAARIAGLVAALALMLCTPFWWVSTRAYMTGVGVLLLLFAVRIVQAYAFSLRLAFALLFCFVYGIGVVEFPTMIVMGPLAAVALIYTMWRAEHLGARHIIALALATLLGLSLYFVAAAQFNGSEGDILRGHEGYFTIIWRMWREQIGTVMHSLPRTGWLIILCLAVLPWLAALTVAKRGLSGDRDWGQVVLHVVITGLAAVVLLNVDKMSPWALTGSSHLLVTPSLLTAALAGYLAVYWFLLFQQSVDADTYTAFSWRGVVSVLLLIPFLVLLGVMAVRSFHEADGRESELLTLCADELVDGLGQADVLVTDGSIDNQILLSAREKGVELQVLNLGQSRNSLYRRYLAGQFDDPTLKNAALLGVFPLVRDMLAMDPTAAARMAIQSAPDMWLALGFAPVPDRLFFRAASSVDEVDGKTLERDSIAMSERLLPVLSNRCTNADIELYRDHLSRHASLVANNLGVLHGDQGDHELAFAAYKRARAYYFSNISALLNLGAMVEKGNAVDADGSIARDLADLHSSVKDKFRVWSLAATYGYVRIPQVYAQLGWTWARSGDMKLAKARLRQAEALFDEGEQDRVQRVLARINLMEGDAVKSADIYEKVLETNPKDAGALRGLATAYSAEGKYDEALSVLDRAEAAGLSKTQVLLRRGQILLQKGDAEKADQTIEDLLPVEPDLLQAWVLKAELLLAQRDEVDLQSVLRRIEQTEGYGGYYSSYLRARYALRQHDVRAARDYLEAAWKANPGNTVLLEWLLQISVALRDRESAQRCVRELLQRKPDNAFGRYVLATLQLETQDDDLAENNLRRSLSTRRSAPALNDLAWLLHRENRLDEAEPLAREAVGMDAGSFEYLETLGVILLREGKYAESRDTLEQALLIFSKRPGTYVYLAHALLELGLEDDARPIVKRLSSQQNRDQLSKEQYIELSGLAERLGITL